MTSVGHALETQCKFPCSCVAFCLLTVWLLSSDIYVKHANYKGEGFFQSIKEGSIKSVEYEIEDDPAYLNSTDRVSHQALFVSLYLFTLLFLAVRNHSSDVRFQLRAIGRR